MESEDNHQLANVDSDDESFSFLVGYYEQSVVDALLARTPQQEQDDAQRLAEITAQHEELSAKKLLLQSQLDMLYGRSVAAGCVDAAVERGSAAAAVKLSWSCSSSGKARRWRRNQTESNLQSQNPIVQKLKWLNGVIQAQETLLHVKLALEKNIQDQRESTQQLGQIAEMKNELAKEWYQLAYEEEQLDSYRATIDWENQCRENKEQSY